jgi:mannose-1-phosphate guanylyltransferase
VAERYLWNSGNFLFHAATMLGEIERFEPAMAEAAKGAVAGLTRDLDFLRLASEPFARAPKKSIDYAVMQRTKLAAVVPADLNPATSYGYIRPGEKLNGASARTVEAFVEKPDAATAANYVAERYLWNSGNFLFHAATMLGEIERFEPAMAEAAKGAVAGLTRDLDFLRLASEPFARAPKKSIDYAVMQRTKLAAVVPADLGWSDIGSWSAVWDVLDHDAAGNATDGPVVMLDSRNSLVRSEEPVLTTVVGLDDVIVVSTADAVLVGARAKAEQVKTLVEQLKAHSHQGPDCSLFAAREFSAASIKFDARKVAMIVFVSQKSLT